MRGPSTAVSELRSCPALPNLWPGACSDYLCHLKEVRREQYSQGRITSDVPAPLEIQAVRDLVRARGKEMQAENLNAQVAAQVCMGLPVLRALSVACGGLAAAWINAAGFFVLTMASKLPSAKKYQRWVFSELAEQMTDMLPSSALFIHLSLSDSVSVLKHPSAQLAQVQLLLVTSTRQVAALQVDAALSAGQLRQTLQTAFQQKQWQWAYLLRMAMTFMPATLGRSDDLHKLPWSCLALRTQDHVGPVPSVAILFGSMQGKTVKPGQVDIPGVVRYAQSCCQTQLGSVLQCVLSYYASSATGTETIASVLRQRWPT